MPVITQPAELIVKHLVVSLAVGEFLLEVWDKALDYGLEDCRLRAV